MGITAPAKDKKGVLPLQMPSHERRASVSNPLRAFEGRMHRLYAFLIDLAIFNIGILLAFYLRFLGPPPVGNFVSYRDLLEFNPARGLFCYTIVIPAVIFFSFGIYRRNWYNEKIEEFIHIIKAVFLASVMLIVAAYAFRTYVQSFPLGVMLISPFVTALLVCGWRLLVRVHYQRRLSEALGTKRLLLIGVSAISPSSLERIRDNENPTYEVVGYLRGLAEKRIEDERGLKSLGTTDDFMHVLRDCGIDEVMLDNSALSYDENIQIIHHCEMRSIRYRLIPSLFDMIASKARVDLLNFVPIIHFGSPEIEGFNGLFKRLIDVTVSAVALILLSPLLIATMIAIRLDSPGFPLFRQKRVGQGGRRFKIYKFRTMRKGAHNGSKLTQRDDPRITRVGGFLRRYSLDELPQLINALIGDMSLVGPRAVVPCVVEKFGDLERMTLNVRPGITGLAQVSGRDELGFLEKSLLNIYYVKNYSLLFDLKILIKTFFAVLSRVGTNGTRLD
jgi:exopolysaccharide biosynthesis polyprenyl glycosylphosphotransferase